MDYYATARQRSACSHNRQHEELIRGIHRISVGHLPPGKEVMVETAYGQTLTYAGGPARLRIPVTVGDVYGRSPLSATEALVTSTSVVHRARLAAGGRSYGSGWPEVRIKRLTQNLAKYPFCEVSSHPADVVGVY